MSDKLYGLIFENPRLTQEDKDRLWEAIGEDREEGKAPAPVSMEALLDYGIAQDFDLDDAVALLRHFGREVTK